MSKLSPIPAPATFSKCLTYWYTRHARALPWRHTTDPYKIWISEVMLQQTTVTTVIPYYHNWLKYFPRVGDVAHASLKHILRLWQGLGYYQRARNIHRAAQIISSQYQGIFPENFETLNKLPGFGPYTTGAILSFAFKKRYPIIDTNIRRIIMRQLAIDGSQKTSHAKAVASFLNRVMPQRSVDIFNQAFMELGALICRRHNPRCHACPIESTCQACHQGLAEKIPMPIQHQIENIHAVVAVIIRDNKYFIQKRPSRGLWADLWEFPGCKVERGASALSALKRKIKEGLNVSVTEAKLFTHVQHAYTKYRVKLTAWICQLKTYPRSDRTHKWIRLEDFAKYPMPSGNAKIVDKLLELNTRRKAHEYFVNK